MMKYTMYSCRSCDQFEELSAIDEIQHVMIFENRGKIIGVSNPHPHGQIYSTDFVPRIPATRYAHALLHNKEKRQMSVL